MKLLRPQYLEQFRRLEILSDILSLEPHADVARIFGGAYALGVGAQAAVLEPQDQLLASWMRRAHGVVQIVETSLARLVLESGDDEGSDAGVAAIRVGGEEDLGFSPDDVEPGRPGRGALPERLAAGQKQATA